MEAISLNDVNGSIGKSNRIPKKDVDILLTAINKIIFTEVLEKELSNSLPITDGLSDSNKIYRGKVSMLFVDMRESTKLPDKFSVDQLVKIYRSYIRTIVQAIRYSGGVVRDFMGDGVLAAFIDDEEDTSENKAVYAARYIVTSIDKLLNPVLNQAIGHIISCGIGIHTGKVSLSKVGMRGKEQVEDAEDEFGIAWIGNSTNLACKYSGAVDNGTIFISSSTYSALSDLAGKQQWREIEISKGRNILKGFVAEKYYLELDNEIEPCTATNGSTLCSLVDELKKVYQMQLLDISENVQALVRKEDELKAKEKELVEKASEIACKEKNNDEFARRLFQKEYRFYCNVLRSGHCQREYVRAMGEEFWEEQLEEAINAGSKVGKGFHEVRQEISYAMVSIYESLESYSKAYDFLVEQAIGCPWLHLFTVQNIVARVGYYDRLKSAVYSRFVKNDLSSDNRQEFEQIKNWLDSR